MRAVDQDQENPSREAAAFLSPPRKWRDSPRNGRASPGGTAPVLTRTPWALR